MRPSRKLLLTLGTIVATLLVVLTAVPYLFRDRIATRLKAELASSVNARLAWDGVGLSLLRDFPNATLSVDRPSVVGVAPFAGDTLVAMDQARLVLDLGSVLGYLRRGDRIVVREIALRQPSVRLHVLPDGRANWNITRPSADTASASKAVGVTLRRLAISGANVRMEDEQSRLSAAVAGLSEELAGDFGSTRFRLTTRTHADTVSVRFAGVPYLTRVALDVNASVDADMAAKRFSFTNDSVRLNNLLLVFAGAVTLGTPDMALDVTFSTPGTRFADILSLVPAIYARDFAQLQTSGSMAASGRVNGRYGPHAFPALALRARVEQGAFKYPSLPLPARDIFMDLAIDNPGGHVDSTVVSLKRFHANLGGRPFDASLTLRTPVSDPDADLRALGSVNLADVARTVKLDGVQELAGVVAVDVATRARLSDVNARRYDRVAASGTINASRVALRSASVPHPVAVDTAALRLTPRTAELSSFAARVGNTDVRATGSLDNLLGFVLHNEDLRGTATVASNHVDLNEWQSKEKSTTVIPVPPHVDFTLAANVAKVTYGAITAANVKGGLHVKDQRVTLENLQMETLRGTVVANGFYETTVPARPTFDVDLKLAKVDIPTAFTALSTVQRFVPIAKWAQGALSGTVGLTGPLASDMTPVFTALTGKGLIETDGLVMQGAPVLEKLADVTKLDAVRKPSMGGVKASFDIADGRLKVQPFTVKMAGIDMTVSGSNGIDQTLRYDLGLAVPKTLLGGSAGAVVSDLAAKAGQAGANVTGAAVQLGALVTGTVLNPSVKANFAGVAGSVREAAQQVVATQVNAAKLKADSAAGAARERARAEAAKLVAAAEAQAAAIRAQARTAATEVQRQGNERADSLLARATNPMAKLAAKAATDRLRKEADSQAERIIKEGDAKADLLVLQARQKSEALAPAKP